MRSHAAGVGWLRNAHQGDPKEILPEFGSAFGPILFPMDQTLLDALALDADQLLEWIDHYPIFSFRMAPVDRPGDKITGVGTRRGLEPTEGMN